MTREEFNIALDMSLTKYRVRVCLEYINEIESRTCSNCKYWGFRNKDSMYEDCPLVDHVYSPTWFGCKKFEKKD